MNIPNLDFEQLKALYDHTAIFDPDGIYARVVYKIQNNSEAELLKLMAKLNPTMRVLPVARCYDPETHTVSCLVKYMETTEG